MNVDRGCAGRARRRSAATRCSNGWRSAAWPRSSARRSSSSHGFEKILVIKRILPHLAADPDFVAMFIDEAKLTAQLTHPKIVQILEFGEVTASTSSRSSSSTASTRSGCCASPRRSGCASRPTLAVFIVERGARGARLRAQRARHGRQAAAIVHRDISPSNIFISRRGDVKLGDFGIARAKRRESKTQAGTLKGKYGYMSPEQVVGRPLDARSDLFAVGIVLAEMLMGRRLFTAPDDLDVLLMVRDARLDRLDKYGADIPPALDRIVRQALKKDPAERPPDRGRAARGAGATTCSPPGSGWDRTTCAPSAASCSTPTPTRPRTSCSRHAAPTRHSQCAEAAPPGRRQVRRRPARRPIRGEETTVAAR